MPKRKRDWSPLWKVLVILYAVVALAVNCWAISMLVRRSMGTTVVTGVVRDSDTQAAVEGATVAIRQPARAGSQEVSATTDAGGKYRLVIPSTFESYELYVVYAGVPGSIVSGPRRKVQGELKPGESEFQIVQRETNVVDWEVSAR